MRFIDANQGVNDDLTAEAHLHVVFFSHPPAHRAHHRRHFLAVADALNFRKAAEGLHMAQPPLSVSIKRLEEDLGTPLFLRERRGVRLTPAGAAMLAHARQAVFHAGEARKSATEAAVGVGGLLRIGFIGSATYTLFPRVLPAFRERYPRVVLELRD